MRVHLARNDGRRWYRHGNAHAKGYAFRSSDDVLLRDADLAKYLDGPVSVLEQKVTALSGEFVAVLHDPQAPSVGAAVVDRIRSIPLFYSLAGGDPVVSDDPNWILQEMGRGGAAPSMSPLAKAEFMLQGWTTGSATLVDGMLQLRAGEFLRVDGEQAISTRYFVYGGPLHLDTSASGPEPSARSRQDLIDEGVAVFETGFQRMLRSVGDAPLAVPLSGGLDSRLVAAMLARAGRGDTLCYSYGWRRGFEAVRSVRVAEQLGFRWAFVPYTNAKWRQWYLLEDYQRYRRDASQFCAIEHEQDWPAVRELKARYLLPEGTVFVPGHTGDFISGSHLPPEAFHANTPADPVAWIWNKHYRLWRHHRLDPGLVEGLRSRIAGNVAGLGARRALPPVLAARAFEQFGWQERQAKMIINSVRVYEHHGFDWRLPLWDSAVMSFWPRMPLFERQHKRLYLDVVRALIGPDLLRIPYTHPKHPFIPAKVYQMLSPNLRIYGAYFDLPPPVALFTRRLRHYVTTDDPVVQALTGPWQLMPLQRAPSNSLLALFTLQDAQVRLNHSPGSTFT